MSLISPRTILHERQANEELGDRSPSMRSTLSSAIYRRNSFTPSVNRTSRLQAGPSIDSPSDLSEDDEDFDGNTSPRENYRFASQIIRTRQSRNNSIQIPTAEERSFRPSNKKSDLLVIQAPPPGTLTLPAHRHSVQNVAYPSMIDNQAVFFAANSIKEIRGQTLLHLAARLGHDEILRLLISETSQASLLMNKKGQTPLLIAIEAGSTSTATLLMEADPRSIIASDNNGSSVFHYACEHCNDIVLHRAIALSKRLNSTSDRITVKSFFFLLIEQIRLNVYFRQYAISRKEISPEKLHSILLSNKVN